MNQTFQNDQEAIDWVRAKTLEVMRWAEKYYGLEDFVKKARLRISARQVRSRAGVHFNTRYGGWHPWVSLGLGVRGRLTEFVEYATIRKHPEIGSVYNSDIKTCLTVLITHEVAHAIDYWSMEKFNGKGRVDELEPRNFRPVVDGRQKKQGGHGVRWQKIYGTLRRKFVNNGLVEPKVEQTKKTKKRTVRRRPQRTIEVVRKDLGYGQVRVYYKYRGEVLAVGRNTRDEMGNYFRIYTAGKDGKMMDLVAELDDGRGARKWVRENLVEA